MTPDVSLGWVDEPGQKRAVTATILGALPGWFGIPEATAEYVDGVSDRRFLVLEGPGDRGDTRAIGFVSVGFPAPGAAELYVLGLLPEYHRRGLGTRALDEVVRVLKTEGIGSLTVKTLGEGHPDEGYRRTRAFYQKCGFVPGAVTDEWGPGNPCLTMVKLLAEESPMNTVPPTCLLVVDVQQALIDEGPHDRDAFLGRLKALLAAARSAGAPVAFVQHADEGLVEGTDGWKVHPSVAPLAGEPTFGKHFSSSFKDTGLEAWLKDRGIGSLVVVGMQTEYCLDATIKSAFEKGYRVTVPVGAFTTYDGRGMTAPQINAWYADQIWDGRFATLVPVDQAVKLLA